MQLRITRGAVRGERGPDAGGADDRLKGGTGPGVCHVEARSPRPAAARVRVGRRRAAAGPTRPGGTECRPPDRPEPRGRCGAVHEAMRTAARTRSVLAARGRSSARGHRHPGAVTDDEWPGGRSVPPEAIGTWTARTIGGAVPSAPDRYQVRRTSRALASGAPGARANLGRGAGPDRPGDRWRMRAESSRVYLLARDRR